MELDDFRESWKQQPISTDTSVPLSAAALQKLLIQGSDNPIRELRRNAWMELGFTILLLLAGSIGLLYVESNRNRASVIWLIVLCLISLVSYHRHMLRRTRDLQNADMTIREHITQRLNSVRQILRLSYRSFLWTLPVSLGIGLFFSVSHILTEYSGRMLGAQLGMVAVGHGIAWLLAYFVLGWFARQYLQHLYGQHLDRLEGYLRELQAE